MEESAWMMGTWSMIISVMLTGIGGLGIFSSIAWIIYEYIRQNHVVSFNINTTQPCYEWIILWLKKHGPLSTIQHLTLVTKVCK